MRVSPTKSLFDVPTMQMNSSTPTEPPKKEDLTEDEAGEMPGFNAPNGALTSPLNHPRQIPMARVRPSSSPRFATRPKRQAQRRQLSRPSDTRVLADKPLQPGPDSRRTTSRWFANDRSNDVSSESSTPQYESTDPTTYPSPPAFANRPKRVR